MVLPVLAGDPQPSALGHGASPEPGVSPHPCQLPAASPVVTAASACGAWENLGRTCGFGGLKCLKGRAPVLGQAKPTTADGDKLCWSCGSKDAV